MLSDKKILVITRHWEKKSTSRLHLKFLGLLKNDVSEYTLLDGNSAFTSRNADGKVCVDPLEVYEKYKPDIVIGYTSYGFARNFFSKFPCKKVMIETDFYKRINDLDWYRENKFDLIIQRGSYDPTIEFEIPMVYLPFSADEKEFFPLARWKQRKNIVGFAGSRNSPIYADRRNAIEKLSKANLLKLEGTRIKGYPKFIRSVKMFLTSTEIDSAHGKTFETLASGTVLLTPPFSLQEELFGPPSFGCVVYKKDGSDIVKKVRELRKNTNLAKDIAENGYKIFLEKHTHSHRIKELKFHLSNLLSERPQEKIWSI